MPHAVRWQLVGIQMPFGSGDGHHAVAREQVIHRLPPPEHRRHLPEPHRPDGHAVDQPVQRLGRAAVRSAQSDQCGAAAGAAERAEPVPGDEPAHGVGNHDDPARLGAFGTGKQVKPPLDLRTEAHRGGAHSEAEVVREQEQAGAGVLDHAVVARGVRPYVAEARTDACYQADVAGQGERAGEADLRDQADRYQVGVFGDVEPTGMQEGRHCASRSAVPYGTVGCGQDAAADAGDHHDQMTQPLDHRTSTPVQGASCTSHRQNPGRIFPHAFAWSRRNSS
jgi:hypothetical protein